MHTMIHTRTMVAQVTLLLTALHITADPTTMSFVRVAMLDMEGTTTERSGILSPDKDITIVCM